jgi:integrase
LALRWRDVDLAGGRLRIGVAKTDAGVRDVPLLPALRDELGAHKAQATFTEPRQLVFCTKHGKPLSKDNTRQRILQKAVERADGRLVDVGENPLPEGLWQHSLRHTYISLGMALGHDLASVAQDVGHADMAVTYRIYTHVMRLDGDERERLKALVEGADWAEMGRNARVEDSSGETEEAQTAS